MRNAKEFGAAFDTTIWPHIPKEGEISSEAIEQHPFHQLFSSGNEGLQQMVSRGETVLQYMRGVVNIHVGNAVSKTLKANPGFSPPSAPVKVVNCTTLTSEVGNALASQQNVSCSLMFSVLSSGSIKCSMRSCFGKPENPAAADVSKIALALGGGGHKCAASFVVKTYNDFLDLFE